MLQRADRLLTCAAGEESAPERFRAAYVAALRGAAVVLAAAGPAAARKRTRNAWRLMADIAPEFLMWSQYFADHSETRAALEAGISRPVTAAAADEFYARVGAFLHDVEDFLRDSARSASGGEASRNISA
ncbi:hypothetical protein FOS14_05630 [Skermania sp. ID1734]|nr:hypothetical protein FOS14_05630 [Skermania sp. ID1734]